VTAFATSWADLGVYQHSWGNYGSGLPYGAWRLDGQGMVHMTGYIAGGASGSVAFNMVAGLRPAADREFPLGTGGDNDVACAVVDGSGNVTIYFSGTPHAVALDAICYLAEQ
jgi:hypothetical protein